MLRRRADVVLEQITRRAFSACGDEDSFWVVRNAPIKPSLRSVDRIFKITPSFDLVKEVDPMAVQAYILIQTEVGKAAQVAKEVSTIAGVTAAEDVTGPYDVIVQAEASSVDDLGKLVVAKIQAVEGITRTLTCPVVHL